MFNTLGVALYCLLGACPVFVAGTGREMSSPYRDELTLTHRVSGVHVRIVHQLLPFRSVPFRSVPGFIASHLTLIGECTHPPTWQCCQISYKLIENVASLPQIVTLS